MKILPLDIKQQDFKKVLRGFAPLDVKIFLEAIAQNLEELIRENTSLKDEMKRQMNQLNDYREKEFTLKETMMTAQKISSDIKTASKKEAELIIQEAELKAEKIINDAHQKMIKIMDRIQELKLDRDRFSSNVRSLVEQHLKILDATATGDKAIEQQDMNLAYLKTQK